LAEFGEHNAAGERAAVAGVQKLFAVGGRDRRAAKKILTFPAQSIYIYVFSGLPI
jgi:hypothetical protein